MEESNMDCTMVFGHNIFIDETLVGYISNNHDGSATLYLRGKAFGVLTSEGEIETDGIVFGSIEDGGDVYIRSSLVGEIDPSNDIRFYGNSLSNIIKG
jgi:hypothetical protein